MTDATVLDWLAQIVVPVVLGGSALAVAIAALKTAKTANSIASSLRGEQGATRDHLERETIARLVAQWSARQWSAGRGSVSAEARTRAAQLAWSRALERSEQPGTDALHKALSSLLSTVPEDEGIRNPKVAAGYVDLTEELVSRWANDPADTAGLGEMVKSGVASILKKANRQIRE